MSYIGNSSTTQTFVAAVDYFSGNGSTVAFTLSKPVASVAQIQAVIANVPQNPSSAFTVSGNTITFTSAPPTGSNNIYVYYTSPNTQLVQPGVGTVQPSSLASGMAGNGPAFCANAASQQTGISATVFTQVALGTKDFDTASCFNNTNATVNGIPAYAFKPNVAGYYHITGVFWGITSTSILTGVFATLYKNGAWYKDGSWSNIPTGTTELGSIVSGMVYLNGTSDYVQLYVWGNTSGAVAYNSYNTYFLQRVRLEGFLARLP